MERDFDEIRNFVEQEIVPRYRNFDAGHGTDHALTVISQALRLAEYYPQADKSMLMVAAAYHDLGLAHGRERHHIHSATIVREDKRLERWFSQDEISIIAEAAEDHRASSGHEPRSIYGRIVAEADRVIDSNTIMRRTIQYGLSHEPQLNREGQYRRVLEHLREKYGENGYLKLWVPQSDNARRLAQFRQLLANEQEIKLLFDQTFDSLMANPEQ